ncbi:MAG: glycosyltransferase [Candidatus Hydrogenedentes bacterium]|nr:glycosyltransferase [Candidatus Hydrogenedentota bacterium]
MRICILTKGEPYGWTRHYIAAFRSSGHEVIVVGPNISDDTLRSFQLEHLDAAASRTDVESELDPSIKLVEVLPTRWQPNLIVAISMAGTPLCPSFAGIACPRVYLSIDTWQSPRDYLDALHYDLVFAAQKSFVPRLSAMGAGNVEWLPLAFNPEQHFPVEMEPRADVSFTGTISLPIHQQRMELIQRLQREVKFIGKTALFGPTMCALCCAGKLTFNHSAVNDVNMRIFEALGMGCATLTNSQAEENGLFDLFNNGEHLVAYSDEEDLIRQTRRYLADDDLRQRIKKAARAIALEHHTYGHRADYIVDSVQRLMARTTRSSEIEESPLAAALPLGVNTVSVVGAGLDNASWRGIRSPHRVVIGDAERADAIVVSALGAPTAAVPEMIERSARKLRDGETLLLVARPQELEALDLQIDALALRRWLVPFGLVLRLALLADEVVPGERVALLAACKRSTTLSQVIDDTFRTLPENCQQVRNGIDAWQVANTPEL